MAVLLVTVGGVQAQDGATVSGQVVDGVSGLELSDVRVQIQGQPGSVLTDARGQLHAAATSRPVRTSSRCRWSASSWSGATSPLARAGPSTSSFRSREGTGTYIERVEVTGDLFRQGEAAVPAQQVLGSADLQNLRGLVLDDPVRAMHILPGVAATDDLYSEFSVRGSDFGRIGLAVDGVPSRFLSHSVQGVEDGGSIGMINSDVLESVSLLNGSYPQRFGNRTGAQIEMALREGSRDRAQARVALGGSSASVVGEGPIGRGRKASWLLSARKSYLDLLIKQIADNETFAFGFTDLAAKVVVDVTARHQVQVSALAGRAALDADQLDIGPNDPLVATNRGWLGALDLAVHARAAPHVDAARGGDRRRVLQSQSRARGARRGTVHRCLGALRCDDRRAPVARGRGRRLGTLAGRAGHQTPGRQSDASARHPRGRLA